MDIGIIKKIVYTPKGSNEQKSFLEMSLRPPLMSSSTFMIVPNRDKQKDNEPDFNILYNFSRRGENYKPTKVGAIWNKTSKDGQTQYKDGYIEQPLMVTGKFYISIFTAKAKDGETLQHTHNVIWSPPFKKDDEQQYETVYETYQTPQETYTTQNEQNNIQVQDDDEIPF